MMYEESFKLLLNFFLEHIEVFETFLLSSIVIYFDKKSTKAFKLRRKYLDSSVRIELPPLIIEKCKELNVDKLDKDFKEDIINFIKIMKDNFKEENFITFNNNFNSLVIQKNESNSKNKSTTSGIFNIYKNQINLDYPYSKSILNHELLHFASSNIKDGILYIGFNQMNNEFNQGIGLNEGYTEYLNQKFFSKNVNSTKIYAYLVVISGNIEKIVGEKMRDYYFSSDLKSLCSNLNNYLEYDEVLSLIKDMDYLYLTFDYKRAYMQEDLLTKAFRNINYLLIKGYANRLKSENNLTINNLKEFVLTIPKTYYSGDKTYYIHDCVDLNLIVEQLCDNNKSM